MQQEVFLPAKLVGGKRLISYQTRVPPVDLVPYEELHSPVCFLQGFPWTNVDEILPSIQPKCKGAKVIYLDRENLVGMC